MPQFPHGAPLGMGSAPRGGPQGAGCGEEEEEEQEEAGVDAGHEDGGDVYFVRQLRGKGGAEPPGGGPAAEPGPGALPQRPSSTAGLGALGPGSSPSSQVLEATGMGGSHRNGGAPPRPLLWCGPVLGSPPRGGGSGAAASPPAQQRGRVAALVLLLALAAALGGHRGAGGHREDPRAPHAGGTPLHDPPPNTHCPPPQPLTSSSSSVRGPQSSRMRHSRLQADTML